LIRPFFLLERKERAIWPSLFAFGAGAFLLAAALLKGEGYRWAAIMLLAAGVLAARPGRLPLNWLGAAVGLFCAWLLFNAAILSPYYSSESLYRPAVLLLGFALAVTLERPGLEWLFRIGAALLALLVLLGLAQLFAGFWHLSQNSQRAAATFITPNTFSTAINLFLLPAMALCLLRRGGWPAFALALWLFAGLLATESRGGYLGFAAGCAYLVAALALARTRDGWRPALRLAGGFVAVAVVFAAALPFARTPGVAESFGTTLLSRGMNYRLELATVAARHLADSPVAGVGANMFRPLYEMESPRGFDDRSGYLYAHNDYLQVWLEFGLLGALLLGAVIVLSFRAAGLPRASPAADPARLACGAALASVFAHALVDFPLYVPFILMLVGANLGALAAIRGGDAKFERLSGIPRPLSASVFAAALLWLSLPVVAEAAANRSLVALFAGNLEGGLRWQRIARWLEPRNPVHYWAEGVMWREQAKSTGNKALAAKSDEMFAEGMRANPYEIVNHLERARLHRQNRALFERPAPAAEVLAWSSEAVRLRPFSLPALIEQAYALSSAGKDGEARKLANLLLDRYPGSIPVLRLATDVKL
jgi:O-antigen ligase